MVFNLELSVSDIIATPDSSITSMLWNFLKCSLTLVLTVTHSFNLFFVVDKTKSIDFLVKGLAQ